MNVEGSNTQQIHAVDELKDISYVILFEKFIEFVNSRDDDLTALTFEQPS